jgi:hypothetical protein
MRVKSGNSQAGPTRLQTPQRIGTITLFAALDVLDGKVIGRCMQRHRHQEFIRFLNTIEAEIPIGKIIHVILDNYGPASPLCVPLHTDLDLQAQRCRGLLRQVAKRRLKRGVFCSIVDLQVAINRFLSETNDDPKPFVWTADPDKIIAAVRRGYQALDSIH